MRAAFFAPGLLLLAVLLASTARADPAVLPEIAHGTVASITDGMTLTLADGRSVRLAGIEAPLPPLGHALNENYPLARTAKETLSRLALGREVSLRGMAPNAVGDLDRYGRLVAQVQAADGTWLEGALLAVGAARVVTSAEHRELAGEMLLLEAQARDRRLGLWRTAFYAVRGAAGLEHMSGRFVLVEAVVAQSRTQRGAVELSFAGGDLTAHAAHPTLALFATAGLDPSTLAGQRIRLRGWVRWAGVPSIELTHPEQIERLGQNPGNQSPNSQSPGN